MHMGLVLGSRAYFVCVPRSKIGDEKNCADPQRDHHPYDCPQALKEQRTIHINTPPCLSMLEQFALMHVCTEQTTLRNIYIRRLYLITADARDDQNEGECNDADRKRQPNLQ